MVPKFDKSVRRNTFREEGKKIFLLRLDISTRIHFNKKPDSYFDSKTLRQGERKIPNNKSSRNIMVYTERDPFRG